VLDFLANQHFQPSGEAAQDPFMLAEEFEDFLGEVSFAQSGAVSGPPRMPRIVLVISDQDSTFGFQVALTLAKKLHLFVDLLEITHTPSDAHTIIPEVVTLNAAGIQFEHHSHAGNAADWLPDHLMQFDDTVAVVAEESDLHREGVLRLEHVLLPVLRDIGLPVVFLIAGQQLLLPPA